MCIFKAGNIANYVHCWNDLSHNAELLHTVRDGVQLPLNGIPDSFESDNYYMPESHKQFITAEISQLYSGEIEKCSYRPHCVSPLKCVPKKGKVKLRLIIDLRKVNAFIDTPGFKYEDINTVIDQIQQEDELISIDLKNGFQNVLVHESYRDYLGFHWQGQYYRYRILPYGLSCSPYFFCKLLRVAANYLRSLGIRTCFYMDDILVMAQAGVMDQQKTQVLLTLQTMGWQINLDKSELLPVKEITYIG